MALPSFYSYLIEQGLIVADTSDVLEAVQNEYKTLFGENLDLDPSTPQGMLIAAEVLARSNMLRSNANVANQINPNYAGGGFLDAICALTGLARTNSSPTVVEGVELTGVPGAIIPSGSQARTTAGDLFRLVSGVVLNGSGEGTGTFQSVEKGPIGCDANALTTVVSAVLGWETVDNPDPGTLGSATQSDVQLRALRKQTLGKQGTSISEAIISAVRLVDGVESLSFLENIAATTEVIEGVSLAPHSVWVCVQGGTDADIGLALLESKSVGANWNGAESVAVTDPASGQEYTVLFDRPTDIPIWVRVTAKQVTTITNPVNSVKDAILNWADNNVENIEGLLVGNSVSPFEIAAAISEQVAGLYVKLVEVSDDGATWQTTEYAIAIDELASITEGHISVTIE